MTDVNYNSLNKNQIKEGNKKINKEIKNHTHHYNTNFLWSLLLLINHIMEALINWPPTAYTHSEIN